ncbi:hypothetical protein [Porphyrobacter sp. HT-58-2]|uniref:hypothetical protein n=1 Tax=Porphyrobacter sp. HT-58-2 TaxID=2023229 RepID=UPI0011B0CF7A|nr:hypothetical protein [Porphyrobacter sp. HT-58-2]
MTCRPSLLTIFAALALVLAGCSEPAGETTSSQTAARNPAYAKLMAEADAALGRGALEEAGQSLDAARELAPDDPRLWVAIARLRFRGVSN